MAKRIPSFSHLHFMVRPDDQGQIVEVSYAYDTEGQRVVRRIYDQSDRSDSYATAEDDREVFEPWNNQRFAHLDWEDAYTGPSLAERLLLDGDDAEASATFDRLNNEGEGFDPAQEIAGWKLCWLADTTDGVAVYKVRRVFANAGTVADEAGLEIDLPYGAAATGLRIRARSRWYDGELLEREDGLFARLHQLS
jgi:hypothetical protein